MHIVGSFREGRPAKLGSRSAVGRNIFIFLMSLLEDASEPFKGSAVYNAIQRALGAKVGPGVCWLGRKHVKSALGPHCYELMSHLVDWPSVKHVFFHPQATCALSPTCCQLEPGQLLLRASTSSRILTRVTSCLPS